MAQSTFHDLHCSLGEGRSITDPITNWVLISGVDIDRDLANMFLAGKYPAEVLGDFLHELMHHWCFHSPVGSAIALLQMRARRNALRHFANSEDTSIDLNLIAKDALRYEAIIGLLRPFAEGLALFAEFDLVPGESEIMSVITTSALTHFTNTENVGDLNAALNQLKARLLMHRMSDPVRERKANLYVQPFSAEDGGYLLGYLCVKNLMFFLRQRTRSEKLFDSDFYLTFMRSFLYEDYGLVSMILDENRQLDPYAMDEQEAVNSIVLYINRRFSQLLNFATDEIMEQFENAVLNNNVNEFWKAAPLSESQALFEKGETLLKEAIAELDFDGPPKTLEEHLKRSDHWSFAQREYMCIGSFRAKVKVNEHHRVFVGEYRAVPGAPLVSVQSLPGVAVGEGEGKIAYFLSPTTRILVMTVTRGDEVVYVNSYSENFTEETTKLMKGFILDHDKATQESILWRTLLEEMLNEDIVYENYLQYYRIQARDTAYRLFSGQALGATPDIHLELAKEILSENGFYGLLNADQIRMLAKLSLIGSISYNYSWIKKTAEELEGVEDTLEQLRIIQEEHKIYFFWELMNKKYITFLV